MIASTKSKTLRPAAQASKPITRCAIYTRKSTEDGLEQDFNSLDAQRDSAESYIRSQKGEGWECITTQYDDGGFTGANMDRPALKRLLSDIEAGKIDCVIVYKVDRLSRSLLDFSRIIEIFDRHKVAFVSVTQAFNTATSMGRLVLNVLLSFAQFEREMISERTRDKMAAARRKGKWVGGMPVLGYTVANSKLVVDPLEACRVEEIFELYLRLQSALAVAKEINERGWRSKEWTTQKGIKRGGHEFDKNSIYALLSNVVYVGRVQYKEETFLGEHQGIISQETFDKAQTLLQQNGRNSGSVGCNKHDPLLQGILRCASCDCGMSHSYSKKRTTLYRYYVCSKAQKRGWKECPAPSLPAAEIEDFVVSQIQKLSQDPCVVRDTLGQARLQASQQAERLKLGKRSLEREIREDYKQLHDLSRSQEDEPLLRETQRSIQSKEMRHSEIGEQLHGLENLEIEEADVLAALGKFDEVWQALSPRERSRAIHLVVERVTYDGRSSSLSITYHSLGLRAFVEELQASGGNGE